MDTRRYAKPITIHVVFSAPQYEDVTLQVQANVRDDLTMYPETLAFGEIKKGTETKATVQVTLVGDANWDIKSIKAESNFIKPEAKPVKRNGNEVTFEISASLRPDLPVGKWYSDVWLTTSNPNVAKIRVPLTVEVNAAETAKPITVNAVTVKPTTLNLGDIKVGDSVEQKILVTANKPFKIKSVQGTDALVSVTGAGSESNSTFILRVNVKPTAMGDIARDVQIVTEGDGATTLTLPVRGKAIKD